MLMSVTYSTDFFFFSLQKKTIAVLINTQG